MPLDLEVLVAVTPAAGKPPLGWLLVNLPSGTARTITHLPAGYIGATLTVLDASPFPRTCPAEGGCVDRLTAPHAFTPSANTRQLVPPAAVTLRPGDKLITPDDEDEIRLDTQR